MRFLLIISMLFSQSTFALTRAQINELLSHKGLTLENLEGQGAKALAGEVTGHGILFNQVRVLLTEHEAILKDEIDSVTFSKNPVLKDVQSVRFNGQYVLKSDLRGAIVSATGL